MNAKLCLIQAPYFDDYGPMRRAAGTYFPLGLGYIAAAAKARGHDVIFLDPNVQDLTPVQVARRVRQEQPDLVGISFMTPQFRSARRLCQAVKELAPITPVILGGAHPSVMPSETLCQIPEADFVAVGEAEYTTIEMLDALRAGTRDFGCIRGLCWRNGTDVTLNAPRPPIEDLDALPFPDRSMIDQSLYRAQSFLSYSTRTATIHTARGCPGRCVFCCSGYKLRSHVRQRSIGNVMAEIDQLRERYDVRYLLIKDDTFTLSKPRVEAFCRALREHHPDMKWHCMGRVNSVDERTLATMRDAGLHDMFFGIESGNDDILKTARKGVTTARARDAVEACARLGIRTYGAFILGLPGETPQTAEQTIAFACSLPLTMAGFSILIPYPGTRVFDEHYHSGGNGVVEYGEFIASTGVHVAEGYTGLAGLSVHELPDLVARAQRRFYLRPVQLWRMLQHANPSMLWGYGRGFVGLVTKERYLRSRRGR